MRDVETTRDNLGQKEAEIASLTERLQRQSESYEREVAELTIQRMQDAYINRMLDGADRKQDAPLDQQRRQKVARQKWRWLVCWLRRRLSVTIITTFPKVELAITNFSFKEKNIALYINKTYVL